MSGKGILKLVGFILFVATAVLCLTFCKDSQPDSLRLVGIDQGQSPVSKGMSLVVVTHGWIEKGRGDWPEQMGRKLSMRQMQLNTPETLPGRSWLKKLSSWTAICSMFI